MTLPVDTSIHASQPHIPEAVPKDVVHAQPQDPIEQVVHLVPIVLPIVGGVLMFLLAFIAVYMA